MRRIRPTKKIKILRAFRRRAARRERRRLPRETRATRIAELVARHRAGLPFSPLNATRVPLLVPKKLSLRENFQETAAFINAVRQYALDQIIPVDLYFDQVEEIEPAALTVLTAEIHRCRNLRNFRGRPLVGGTYPTNSAIYEQLRRIGFFKLLQIADLIPPKPTDEPSAVVVLPFITDAEVTPEKTEAFIDGLAEIIGGVIPMDSRSKRYLYGAIIEAMKNAGEHAYKLKPSHQAMGRRWWLTGAFDLSRREVAILLFDQGVGIPVTLEPDLRTIVESIATLQGVSPPDSLMIEVATRPGQTSTGQPGRGQGFRTMRKFVDACDDGDLLVYSNFGLYCYKRDDSFRADQSASLGGTLIQWRFRHSAELMGIEP